VEKYGKKKVFGSSQDGTGKRKRSRSRNFSIDKLLFRQPFKGRGLKGVRQAKEKVEFKGTKGGNW